MPVNQLFRIMPDRSFVISLLNLYGIEDFSDTRYFTKGNLETLNTIEELNKLNEKLENYYIPCKSKIYLEEITISRSIVILRQFLKIHNYTLISKEKYVKGKKHLFYQVIPQQIDMLTKNRESEKVILSFD